MTKNKHNPDPAREYYSITAELWEESSNDTEPVSAFALRDTLELLHLVQRPDKAAQLYEAAKAVGYSPWDLARIKEALAGATEVLDGIMGQIDDLEREAEA